MSEYDELVKRLRDAGLAYGMGKMPLDAADAIEALVGEVDRLTTNGIHSCWEECPRLPCVQGREIRRLASEVERLKGALGEVMEWVENWQPSFTQDEEWPATKLKARSALEAKP